MLFALIALFIEGWGVDTRAIGFGAAATGGGDAAAVQVTSIAELTNALKASGPSVIVVTKNITFGEGEQISVQVADKTLLGVKGVRLTSTAQVADGGILNLKSGSKNVIIRNLIFEGPGAYDCDGKDLLTNQGAIPLWVDHCEFYDGVDGNFDNVNDADNVTISWCKFGYLKAPKAGGSGGADDHRFTNLVGGSKSAHPADEHYSITFQFCYWSDGCKERMPRARNAELHILNCFYNVAASGTVAMGLEGGNYGLTAYVEGTHFSQVATIYKDYDSSGSKGKTLTFVDCLASGSLPADIGATPKPDYAYTAIEVKLVESTVTSGAGALLTVSTSGVIS